MDPNGNDVTTTTIGLGSGADGHDGRMRALGEALRASRWRLFTNSELAQIDSLVFTGAEHMKPPSSYEDGYESVDRLKAELGAAFAERQGENFAAIEDDTPAFTASPSAELPDAYRTRYRGDEAA